MDSRRRTHLAAAAGAALVGFGAYVLLRFPPSIYHFYPVCPIRSATGLLCPGCGATRALGLLLHGQLGEALRQNALFVLLLPCVALYFAVAYRRGITGRPWPRLPHRAVMVLLALAALFTLYRNLA